MLQHDFNGGVFELKIERRTVRIEVFPTGAIKIGGSEHVQVVYDLGIEKIPVEINVHPFFHSRGNAIQSIEMQITKIGDSDWPFADGAPSLGMNFDEEGKNVRVFAISNSPKRHVHELGMKPLTQIPEAVKA